MFLKPLPSTKAKEKKSVFEIGESEVFPSFRLNYDFLECFKKPLSLATTRKRRSDAEKIAEASQEKIASTSLNADEVPASVDSVVRYTEEELTAFKENMASENTKKSTGTSVRRLQSWYMEKYQTELNLNSISKTEAPRLLKHFFVKYGKRPMKTKAKNTSQALCKPTVMVSGGISSNGYVRRLLTTLTSTTLKTSPQCSP